MRFRFIQPRLMTRDEAGEYVGCPAHLKKMETAGWIKPATNGRKLKFFDKHDLDHCIDRAKSGESPGE